MIYDEQSQKKHRFFLRSSFCDASFLCAIIKNDIPLRSSSINIIIDIFFSIYYCIRRIMFFLFRLYRWSAYNITFIFFFIRFSGVVFFFHITFIYSGYEWRIMRWCHFKSGGQSECECNLMPSVWIFIPLNYIILCNHWNWVLWSFFKITLDQMRLISN